ncbi:hypothetical protein V1L54_16570 [Streptomyces sp. TRM 70361]|uniref:hypothetical protein n=1 Tax=Streptomyces sp. TRM 70361 TaxID=3116553 RepID=UPI002E7C4FD8|nr:hypothetical protein [Streptomyces sp. TRM 70361]MEE1940998.1 hypothetical protein [Streptomyces sp. TRM 70361]
MPWQPGMSGQYVPPFSAEPARGEPSREERRAARLDRLEAQVDALPKKAREAFEDALLNGIRKSDGLGSAYNAGLLPRVGEYANRAYERELLKTAPAEQRPGTPEESRRSAVAGSAPPRLDLPEEIVRGEVSASIRREGEEIRERFSASTFEREAPSLRGSSETSTPEPSTTRVSATAPDGPGRSGHEYDAALAQYWLSQNSPRSSLSSQGDGPAENPNSTAPSPVSPVSSASSSRRASVVSVPGTPLGPEGLRSLAQTPYSTGPSDSRAVSPAGGGPAAPAQARGRGPAGGGR